MKYVKHYDAFLSESTSTYSEIIRYIQDISPKDSDYEHMLDLIRASKKTFELKTVNIEKILDKDIDAKEYVINGGDRYENQNKPQTDLKQPIVILKNTILDGYSRIATLYKNGETTIHAWVA